MHYSLFSIGDAVEGMFIRALDAKREATGPACDIPLHDVLLVFVVDVGVRVKTQILKFAAMTIGNGKTPMDAPSFTFLALSLDGLSKPPPLIFIIRTNIDLR